MTKEEKRVLTEQQAALDYSLSRLRESRDQFQKVLADHALEIIRVRTLIGTLLVASKLSEGSTA